MVTGCEAAKDKTSEQVAIEALPYYEEATFTPQWFSTKEEIPEDFHQIPKFSLVNQLGDSLTEEVFDNKISIVNFFFTTCPGICPKMMANMDLVQEQLKENEKLQLLSYSVTPEMDGVPELKEYAEKNGIMSDNWYLITGERDVIYELGRNQFFVEEDMGLEKGPDDFLHTENILLIDGERHIRGIYNGLNKTAINQMIADVETLQAELLVR
ncbi:SenC [Cyclobacterium qasimii M12-11B]|nr:SenC [Cyclobacterium qasimii M12-11B]